MLREFPNYHWIYWLGPCLGGVIAAVFYHLVKVLEYETANPGADFNELEMNRFAFYEENAATGADAQRPDLTSPPLAPSVAGYRGRSASTRTRQMSPIDTGISLSESRSSHAVHEKSPSDTMGHQHLTLPATPGPESHPSHKQPSAHFLATYKQSSIHTFKMKKSRATRQSIGRSTV